MKDEFIFLDEELLSIEEEKEYLKKIKNGDKKLKKEFINKNKGLVYSIAKKYCSSTVLIDDLFQQGIIGLITAIDKFDTSSDYKFSTYATYWIRLEIRTYALSNKRLVYYSSNLIEKIEKYNNILPVLTAKYARKPTKEEILDALNWKESVLDKVLKYNNDCLSLNKTITDDYNEQVNNELVDFVSLDYNLQDEVDEKLETEAVNNAIKNANLTEQEKEVIYLRYFDINYINASNQEIGNAMKRKVSGERIRQIEAKALRKLKYYIQKKEKTLDLYEPIETLSKEEKLKMLKDESFFLYVMEEKSKAQFPDGVGAYNWFKYNFDRNNKKTYISEEAIEVLQLCKKYKDKYPIIKNKII